MDIFQNNFCCLSTVSFFHPTWTNKQQLMLRLSQHCPVYFVEDPVLAHLYFQQKRYLKPIEKINSNLTIIRPWKLFPFSSRFNIINKINYHILSSSLKQILPQDLILWIYEPKSTPVLDYIPHKYVHYDCVDDYSQFPNSKHFTKLELELVKKSDSVSVSSPDLYEKFTRHHSKISLIPNGADLWSQKEKLPGNIEDKILNLKGPKFLFAGSCNFKLDIPLIANHALENFNCHFIFVGDKSIDFPKLPNIHYFQAISNRALKALYDLVDYSYIPYKPNLPGVNPLKVYEAMSIGKPIYGTILESIQHLDGLIINCEKTPISKFLKLNFTEISSNLKKFHETKQLSWDHRLNKILKLIQANLYA